jgi:hypothetical protein
MLITGTDGARHHGVALGFIVPGHRPGKGNGGAAPKWQHMKAQGIALGAESPLAADPTYKNTSAYSMKSATSHGPLLMARPAGLKTIP